MVAANLPAILVTGASGFVGRYLLTALKNDFRIHAIARRTQQESSIEAHANIQWHLVDIGNRERLEKVFKKIIAAGGVDYVIHLAGYYDFGNEPNPEYRRTNVDGTRNILELTRELDPKRFIFASSVAACNFPPPGEALTEDSPVDADYPYAWSKREGEKMVKRFSEDYPCSTVRFAAVYSDWCEYGVLYMFLNTWCSKNWKSRILGGHGESAIPFVHIQDLIRLLTIIMEKSSELPSHATYLASPDGCVSHRQLFEAATRLYFVRNIEPFGMPRILALLGISIRDFFGRLINRRPFERPWMMKYIDLRLNMDASRTRKELGWELRPRLAILRRLIYLIEHMKGNPAEWHQRNLLALRIGTERPNLVIASALELLHETLIEQICSHILAAENKNRFRKYRQLSEASLRWYIGICFDLLVTAVRTGDRLALVNYARFLAGIRSREGFECDEICHIFEDQLDIIIPALHLQPGLKGLEMQIHESIGLTIQLAVDEIEDAYETIAASSEF